MRRIINILALLATAMVAASSARADVASSPALPDGWSFAVAPYLWAAGMDGQVATLPPARPADVDAGFGDILDDLSFALMGMGEIRHGRVAIVADIVYVDLKDDATTPGPFFSGVELESETFIGTFQASYRVLDDERAQLDLRAGARVWNVSTALDLRAGLLAARSRDDDETWVDPIVGAQGRLRLGSGFYLTGLANIGGFGAASDLTWDVFGGIGHQTWIHFAPVIGYRHLSVEYEDDGFLFDMDMSGPMVGGVFRF